MNKNYYFQSVSHLYIGEIYMLYICSRFIYIYIYRSGRPVFNSRSNHTKDFKKWYLIPPCLTLSIIRYISRVKWSNPGKGVVPFFTSQCSSYWKVSLRVTLNYSRQLYLLTIYIYIYTHWKITVEKCNNFIKYEIY